MCNRKSTCPLPAKPFNRFTSPSPALLHTRAGASSCATMKSSAERFWSKVKKASRVTSPHVSTPCWNWTASIWSGGYGSFHFEGKDKKSHRHAWELTYGKIPDGLFACHHCDNKICVNPEHLFLGGARENQVDLITKGLRTIACGEGHGEAKLTKRQVIQIKKRRAKGHLLMAIAKDFNVSRSNISSICLNKSWRLAMQQTTPTPKDE